jgi:SAM-dependent methyltransferase
MFADQALDRILMHPDVIRILDVGSGSGDQARRMKAAGKSVLTNSLVPPADRIGPFETLDLPDGEFDCVWMSHVLEHAENPGSFLKKAFRLLRDDGVLAVTVPPHKHGIVGGHCNLFNAGLLLYRLILAGFDCGEARVGSYGYNVSVIVRKKAAAIQGLVMDRGDIERLSGFFPCQVSQGFDGRLSNISW